MSQLSEEGGGVTQSFPQGNDVRARWVGHRLHVEVSVTVPDTLSVGMGHEIAKEARHPLLHHLPTSAEQRWTSIRPGRRGASPHRASRARRPRRPHA
jgi:divalent metal cation (Fe/Co/Zn/Cd) transporter